MSGFQKARFLFHRITSPLRDYPDFIILGNSFCAKTLLYNYLTQHRLILKNIFEESAFFVDYYEKGSSWYKANFPLKIQKSLLKRKSGKIPLVGETINLPYYEIPERVHKLIPNPKIIVILRDPIDRAYASYSSLVKKGIELLTFEEAVLKKIDRWADVNQKLTENQIEGLEEKISTYLSNSIYVYDIKNWIKYFPKEKMLFLKSEDLFEKPLETVNNTLEFLGLEPLVHLVNYSERLENTQLINTKIKEDLNKFFKPYNKLLYELLGCDLGWD
jgi:hypothetical protein